MEDLKIQDVATLLNVSQAKIRRLIDEGFPSYQIDGQHRFNRSEVESWMMDKKREQKGEFILSDEQEHGTKGGTHQFSLYRALHRGGIFTDIPGTTKEELIRNTMVHLAKHLELDADVLTELLIERENLQPTALNQGLAVPHTRDFLLSSRHDAVTIVFPETPIPYGALDGKPVHTLFFLFACSDKHHLNLLAKIAHLSSNPDAITLFNSRPNKEKVLAFIKDWEAHLKK